jgi:hypothetical protein
MSPDFYSPVFWLQLALALIGVGGLVAALKTLNNLERQTIATEIAANAAKKSADTAEAAMRLTERADILLDSAGLSVQTLMDADVILRFKNFGRTRALAVRFNVTLLVNDIPQADPAELGPMLLGAGDEQTAVVFPLRMLPDNVRGQVFRAQTPMTFAGQVTYQDVFGVTHRTECTGRFLIRNGQPGFIVERNEAD